MAKQQETFTLSTGVRMDKTTDVKTVLEFAKRADKNCRLGKKDVSEVQNVLEPDEQILYIALTGVVHNYNPNENDSVLVLTDSRFFYMRAKGLIGVFSGALKIIETITLDQIEHITVENPDLCMKNTMYMKIITSSRQVYDIELPKNKIGQNANLPYWTAIFQAFNQAKLNYVNSYDDSYEFDDPFESDDERKKDADDYKQLEQLASLRDKGIITEEEFQTKKKQILGL